MTAQLLAGLGGAWLAWLHTPGAAFAVLLGGAICLISSTYFATRVLGWRSDPRPPGRTPGDCGVAIRAELVKLALVVVMLTAVFVSMREVDVLALLGGYFLVHLTGIAIVVSNPPVDPALDPDGRRENR